MQYIFDTSFDWNDEDQSVEVESLLEDLKLNYGAVVVAQSDAMNIWNVCTGLSLQAIINIGLVSGISEQQLRSRIQTF